MRFILALGVFLLTSTSVEAATLYLDPPAALINRGDAIKVAIRLDTDEQVGECINAVDAVVTYPESIIPIDISTGQSIIPIWVESPIINKENRTITLAGGIPNGYCGRVEGDPRLTNIIAEVVFRAPGLQIGGGDERGVADIAFGQETTLYLNDGLGTKAPTATLGAKFTISDTVGSNIVDDWREEVRADDTAPEEFSITLEHDETTFGGNYYIVFNTTDKQTGLSHYEVIEEPIDQMELFGFGAATAPWVEAISPYELNDQTLNSAIRVRAIDKAGNEYVASLLPEESLRQTTFSLTHYILFGAVLLLTILIIGICVFVYRRIRKNKHLISSKTEVT